MPLAVPAQAADDRSTYRSLVTAGFSGPVYERFADKCVRYAYPILCGWIASGSIFGRLPAPAGHLPPRCPARAGRPPEVDDLVQDTLAAALQNFADRGRAGQGWSEEGGASLATYFVRSCLMAFPNIYRKWERQERRFQYAKESAARLPAPVPRDPAELAVVMVYVRDVLTALGEPARAVVLMNLAGYSQVEIGAKFGMTARAVEGIIYRTRQRCRAYQR